jgi:hypothetical protein
MKNGVFLDFFTKKSKKSIKSMSYKKLTFLAKHRASIITKFEKIKI